MQKAALLYNPNSGGNRRRKPRDIESVLTLLRGSGVQAEIIPTPSSALAEQAATRAVSDGCDTVFACGGDGTIHNVIQGLANTSVALAVLPMGTANALAHDLHLPMNVVAAAQLAMSGIRRKIALGRLKYQDLQGNPKQSYFAVASGIGVDAHLFYKLNPSVKQRLGMVAYYAKAWHMWFNYSMARFVVEYVESGSSEVKQANVTELLGVRIRNFGGVLRELAPGASLEREDLRLVFCHTEKRMTYLSYVTRVLVGGNWSVPGIELAHSSKVSCRYALAENGSSAAERKIYVEADGELLGTLPVEITTVPNALTILAP
ncbi:MAG TPA: YegS/Rv2252/BmrU family lipid kinase [Candidatus Sulfotelmatobacter sp.]|nr:YegS/Rv2252/BmrU family lipid kinase [Candidatus Sulfotelmatobacter sp.]